MPELAAVRTDAAAELVGDLVGDLVILEPKVHRPVLRPEHVPRPRLLQQLDAGRTRRLTLVDAPTGYGKSTLLAEWCRTAAVAGRVAWLALDAQDNDPVVFWTYLIEALRRVEPAGFDGSRAALLRRPGVRLMPVALPQLLNELWALDQPLTLILDDYHVLQDQAVHESVLFVLRRLPPHVRLVIATRSDPPLGLSQLRADGELCELRAADLAFTAAEVETLLNDALGIELADADVATLTDRTEGWAAGLYLAALSLRGQADRAGFIAAFAGDHRHLVAYLGSEVLEQLAADTRTFLLETSILDRLSPDLCDAVSGTSGSAARLQRLEETNQFLIPLDERGMWYRYHHLFQELLQLELKQTQPGLMPVLHARAAAWYRTAGDVTAAMEHALTAGDYTFAADLYLESCFLLHQTGQLATLLRWADALPEATVVARPALAVVVGWLAAAAARPPWEMERWLALAETADEATDSFYNGMPSAHGAVALVRAVYPVDDIGQALAAAETAVAEASDPTALASIHARMALGQCLYLAGRPEAAQPVLEAVLHAPLASRQALGVIHALAHLTFVALQLGELGQAGVYARRANELCAANGLTGHLDTWLTALAVSAVQLQYRRFDQAAATMATGVEPYLPVLRHWSIPSARALLVLASVRYARGHRQAAHELLAEARAVIEACADPGILRAQLATIETQLHRPPRHRATSLADELTDGELRVLRLLASDLSQREIARELYVSVNTVKSHTRIIYAKLGTTCRDAAIRRARELTLLF
jgi:LuxR family maltose regulon positive regulatory protein